MPCRREGLWTQELGDEAAIYDRGDQQLHALNPSAAMIWQLCDGKHDVDTIAEELTRRFDAPIDQIRPEVVRILDELRAKSLLGQE
ncbi:PqqD family protein [Verrucomicrobiota bacterium]